MSTDMSQVGVALFTSFYNLFIMLFKDYLFNSVFLLVDLIHNSKSTVTVRLYRKNEIPGPVKTFSLEIIQKEPAQKLIINTGSLGEL
jgi:hypothetical protein